MALPGGTLSLFPARVPFVDLQTGILTPEAYRALTQLFRGFTGLSSDGGSDVYASTDGSDGADGGALQALAAFIAPEAELGPLPDAPVVQEAAWPVGSIFISTVATNPSLLLGYGTWVAFGTGRTMFGLDSGNTNFDTLEETGGAADITIDDHDHHTHAISSSTVDVFAGVGSTVTQSVAGNTGNESPTLEHTSGGVSPIVTLPPYIVVQLWKRTA